MTLNAYKHLEEYFHAINQLKQKEPTMFEQLKAHFLSLWTKPVKFVEENQSKALEEDYWSFEMVTNAWINEHGEAVPVKHTYIIEPHEGTWMEVLDKVLDELEKHYGYNIKEQVYYSVEFPYNDPEFAGYGRCLNDERLQQILLAFPELYQSRSWSSKPEQVEGMFK